MSDNIIVSSTEGGSSAELPKSVEQISLFSDARVEKIYHEARTQLLALTTAERSYSAASRMEHIEPLIDGLMELMGLAKEGVKEARELLNDPEFLKSMEQAGVDLSALEDVDALLVASGTLHPTEIREALQGFEEQIKFLGSHKAGDASTPGRIRELRKWQACLRAGDPSEVRRALQQHQKDILKELGQELAALRQTTQEATMGNLAMKVVRGLSSAAEGGALGLSDLLSQVPADSTIAKDLADVGIGLELVTTIASVVALSKNIPALSAVKEEFLANLAAEKKLEVECKHLQEDDPHSSRLPKLQEALAKQKQTNEALKKALYDKELRLTFQAIYAGGSGATELLKLLSNIKAIQSQAAALQHIGSIALGAISMGDATYTTIAAIQELIAIHKEADDLEKRLSDIADYDPQTEEWNAKTGYDPDLVVAIDLKLSFLRQIKTIQQHGRIAKAAFDFSRSGASTASATVKLLALKGVVSTVLGPIGLTLLGAALATQGLYYFGDHSAVFMSFFRQIPLKHQLSQVDEKIEKAMKSYTVALQRLPRVRSRAASHQAKGERLLNGIQKDSDGKQALRHILKIYSQAAVRTLGDQWRGDWQQSSHPDSYHIFSRPRSFPVETLLDQSEQVEYFRLSADTSDQGRMRLREFLRARRDDIHKKDPWMSLGVSKDGQYVWKKTETFNLQEFLTKEEREELEGLQPKAESVAMTISTAQRYLSRSTTKLRHVDTWEKVAAKAALSKALPLVKTKLILQNRLAEERRMTAKKAEVEKLGADTEDMEKLRLGLEQVLLDPKKREGFGKFMGQTLSDDPRKAVEAVITYMFS